VNASRRIEDRIQMVILDNNPTEAAEYEKSVQERDSYEWDNLLTCVIGWGKTHIQQQDRQKLSTDAAHVAKVTGLPVTDVHDTSDLHFETAPKDWLVSMSERALHLDRKDMWLGNNDKDYHRPMFVTLRNFARRNDRYRTEAREVARRNKRRMRVQEMSKGSKQYAQPRQSNEGWRSSSSGWNASGWTAAATWSASSWQANAERVSEDTELVPLPLKWHWMDIIMLLIFLMMVTDVLVRVFSYLNTKCRKPKAVMATAGTQT